MRYLIWYWNDDHFITSLIYIENIPFGPHKKSTLQPWCIKKVKRIFMGKIYLVMKN